MNVCLMASASHSGESGQGDGSVDHTQVVNRTVPLTAGQALTPDHADLRPSFFRGIRSFLMLWAGSLPVFLRNRRCIFLLLSLPAFPGIPALWRLAGGFFLIVLPRQGGLGREEGTRSRRCRRLTVLCMLRDVLRVLIRASCFRRLSAAR